MTLPKAPDITPMTLIYDEPADPQTEAATAELLGSWDRALFGDGPVRIRPLLGGANNQNFVVECDQAKYALRVANPLAGRLAVDRASALQAQRDAAAAGVAPDVLAWRLPEGHLLSEFCHGTVLSLENLHEEEILRAVGESLARLHAAPTTARPFSPFEDIRTWTEVALQDEIPLSSTHLELVDTAYQVKALVGRLPLPDVFCHNDTVPQNFIRTDAGVSIVDWDYAGRGLACFELGSFACTADLDEQEIEQLVAGYGVAPTPATLARMGLMSVVAAVREIAWVIMAAPVLAGSTGVSDAWYDEYFASNSARAHELKARWCTTATFAEAAQHEPGSTV